MLVERERSCLTGPVLVSRLHQYLFRVVDRSLIGSRSTFTVKREAPRPHTKSLWILCECRWRCLATSFQRLMDRRTRSFHQRLHASGCPQNSSIFARQREVEQYQCGLAVSPIYSQSRTTPARDCVLGLGASGRFQNFGHWANARESGIYAGGLWGLGAARAQSGHMPKNGQFEA